MKDPRTYEEIQRDNEIERLKASGWWQRNNMDERIAAANRRCELRREFLK